LTFVLESGPTLQPKFGNFMDKCNGIDKLITDVTNADREAQAVGEERVESLIAEGDAKRRSIWSRILNKQYDKTITEKMADDEFIRQYDGPDGRQALLANKIEDLLKQNDIRAYVFNEHLLYDIGKHEVWEMADYKDGKPILESLPIQYLNGLYAKLWNFGMEKDWGSAKFRIGKISFGRPFNLKWNDSSGGYAILEKAVAQFPGNVNRSTGQFLKFNGKRRDKDGLPYGMNEVYKWGGEVFDMLDPTTQRQMADYHGTRAEAKSYMIAFMTMYLNGWIKMDSSTDSFQINTEYLQAGGTYTAEARFITGEHGGKKGKILKTRKNPKTEAVLSYDIVLEDGAILTNVNASDVNAPEKDFIFQWDNPITIKPYDDFEHGAQYSKKNGKPLDLRVVDFLKGYFPMGPKAVKRMSELYTIVKGRPKTQNMPAFKGLHEEVFEWAEGVTDQQGKLIVPGERQKSEKAVRDATLRWMVDENQKPYDEELVKQALQAVWDVNYEVGPDVPQHLIGVIEDLRIFNEFTMFENMFWDSKPMEKKDSFPIQFVDVKLTHQFRQFKPRLLEEIKILKDKQAQAQTGKRLFDRPIAELESALEHANWALEKGQGIPEESMEPGGKLMTKNDSVHAKHITNAFDPMEMRVDSDLYQTYLNNQARKFERNYLNAKLMDSVRIVRRDKQLNPDAVEEAILALHGATIGDNSVRAMWAGIDMSSAAVERMFKKVGLNIPQERIDHYGKRLNMHMTAVLLNQYMTAAFNATQAIEKDMHYSHEIHKEMTAYYVEYKNDPGLQQLLQKAGVSAFTDYFSQNLIGEMQALESGFNQAIPAMQAILRYYKAIRKGANDEKAFDDLFVAFEKAMRMPLKRAELPSFDEAKREMKQMNRQEKLATINKLANWAITKEWKGAKSRGTMKRLKDSLKSEFSFFAATVPKDLMGFPTMAGTESTTRSLSWLIRAEVHRRMMKYETTLHYLEPAIDKIEEALIKRQDLSSEKRSVIKEELKSLKKQRQEYLLLGKISTREMDYDLEKGLYSESSRSVWGKFAGLFGDFGKQRMEQEGVKIKEAYRSYASEYYIEGKGRTRLDPRAFFLAMADIGKGLLPEAVHMALRKEIGLKQAPGGKTKLGIRDYVSKDTRQTTNRQSATLQRLGSIWMWTWLYNGVLFGTFGPATTFFPQLSRKIMRKMTGSHKLGNANSDIASLIQAPFSLLLAYALYQGGDEEDEEIRDLWDSIVQSIPLLGVGGSAAWNVLMGAIHIGMSNIGEAWNSFGKTIKTGVPKEFHPIIDEGLEVLEEETR
jgi:hypothetical protein